MLRVSEKHQSRVHGSQDTCLHLLESQRALNERARAQNGEDESTLKLQELALPLI